MPLFSCSICNLVALVFATVSLQFLGRIFLVTSVKHFFPLLFFQHCISVDVREGIHGNSINALKNLGYLTL